jgi:hypothetical protein
MTRSKKKTRMVITRSAVQRARRVVVLTSVCVSLLLAIVIPLEAKSKDKPKPQVKDYALIFGTVWGPDDFPIYGIRVNLRRADQKKARWHVYTNHRGGFGQRVPVGKADYVIWAETKGIKLRDGRHLQRSPEVTLHIESNERADTGLHLK